MTRTVLLLAFTALLSACTPPRQVEVYDSASAGATSRDTQFMGDLTRANLAEIAASKLAVTNAASPAVRSYAERMVNAHIALQTEGSQVASDRGLRVPTSPDARHQAALKELEKLTGTTFERAYLEQMLKDHADTVVLLERAATQANDPRLRAHAQQALPHVREHLDETKRLTGDVPGRAN